MLDGDNGQAHEENTLTAMNEHVSTPVNLELTFAGLHALKPLVIHIFVAGSPTPPKPSTARSATTDSAGFLERATLWAR